MKKIDSSHLVSLFVFTIFLMALFFAFENIFFVVLSGFCLGLAIFSAVHHAEVLAHRLGEIIGSLLLALSVTIIEVALIVILMLNSDSLPSTIARDTIYSVVMLVLNGIVGLSIILGAFKHKEQPFHVQGASSLLALMLVLTSLTLILPSFTTSIPGPTYNNFQLIFAATASFILYLVFLFTQTVIHKKDFEPVHMKNNAHKQYHPAVSKKEAIFSFLSLLLSLIAVVGLSKLFAPRIENLMISFGAPKASVGLIIAMILLLPECFAAVSAARSNRLQTTLNLALGSGAASIALTIPIVSIFSLITSTPLALGVNSKEIVFLTISFLLGGITLQTGRATLLQGALHFVILLAFIAITFVP